MCVFFSLSYELIQRRDKNQMEVRKLPKNYQQFYVWDHVAVALHLDKTQVPSLLILMLRRQLKFSLFSLFSLT